MMQISDRAFEAFMLTMHEYGHTGLGIRRCLEVYEAAKTIDRISSMLDPAMPAQELRLHMGELTANEALVARAAIRWTNAVLL